jgi:hypothetical protein
MQNEAVTTSPRDGLSGEGASTTDDGLKDRYLRARDAYRASVGRAQILRSESAHGRLRAASLIVEGRLLAGVPRSRPVRDGRPA